MRFGDYHSNDRFGPFHPMTLATMRAPPSNKSATSNANFHWPIISFGQEPSTRIGAIPPYDRVYFWSCINCPAQNGAMAMCCHVAAFLCSLSYPEYYNSMAKTANLLNTVAVPQWQTLEVLPRADPALFPQNIT